MELLEVKALYDRALAEYEPVLQQIALRDEIYNGTHRYRYGGRGEILSERAQHRVRVNRVPD